MSPPGHQWDDATVTLVGMEPEPLPPPPGGDTLGDAARTAPHLPPPPAAARETRGTMELQRPADLALVDEASLPPPPPLPGMPRQRSETAADYREVAEATQVGAVAADALSPRELVPRSAAPAQTGPVSRQMDTQDLFDEHLSDTQTLAGRYRIEEAIGEGGMGKVFRVRHVQLGKSFALKLMRRGFHGDSRARSLFYREARLASSLAHPGIVSIIDFGEDDKLGAFMVMELLTGEPLSDRLKQDGRFSVKLTLEIIQQIAEALHYIHQKQVIHCDIKPENILLCRVPGTDKRRMEVKLLDFGLARVDTGVGPKAKFVDGTPEYMAPERICGQSPQPSMDIYGLGVLAYELLTGRLPFMGSVQEVMKAHVHREVPPLGDQLDQPLDERIEAFIYKSLAKSPKDRHKDMAAFIYEVRTLMDMLGYGRRRGLPRANSVAPAPRDPRERAAHVSFDLTPLPLAGVNVDGTVIISNRAFNRFITGSGDKTVEKEDIFQTKLAQVHPHLAVDVGKVHREGVPLQRTLRLKSGEGGVITLYMWLVPGVVEAGDVHISVHRVDA